MWKFIIRQNVEGKIDYILRAEDGRIILQSKAYSSDNACRKGIASVTKNSRTSHLEDHAVEGIVKEVKHPKYELYQAQDGGSYFQLKASNGQIVGISEVYKSKEECLEGIAELRKQGPAAVVDD